MPEENAMVLMNNDVPADAAVILVTAKVNGQPTDTELPGFVPFNTSDADIVRMAREMAEGVEALNGVDLTRMDVRKATATERLPNLIYLYPRVVFG